MREKLFLFADHLDGMVHISLVRDATAAMSQEAMHAAQNINAPTYAHEVINTAELLQLMQTKDAIS